VQDVFYDPSKEVIAGLCTSVCFFLEAGLEPVLFEEMEALAYTFVIEDQLAT